MANPQAEHGHIRIATEIWEALVRTRIPGEARQMLDFIIRKTYGYHKKHDQIATSQIIEATGLTRKIIERARKNLRTWNLITTHKKEGSQILVYSFNKDYETWKLPPKKVPTTLKKEGELPPKKQGNNIYIDNTIDKSTPKAADALKQQETSAQIKEAMDKVQKEGFSIYAMVQKARIDLGQPKGWLFPDQVILNICAAYQREKDRIHEPWPWFQTVLIQEYKNWNSNGHEEESEKSKEDKRSRHVPESMKSILEHAKL